MTIDCPCCERIIVRDSDSLGTFSKCSACGCDFYITPSGIPTACVDVSKLPGVRIQEVTPYQHQPWHGPTMDDVRALGQTLRSMGVTSKTHPEGVIPELETMVDRHVPAVTDTFLCCECKQQFSDVETDAHCSAHSTRNPHFTDSRRRRFCNCCAELYAQVANSPYWVRVQQGEGR